MTTHVQNLFQAAVMPAVCGIVANLQPAHAADTASEHDEVITRHLISASVALLPEYQFTSSFYTSSIYYSSTLRFESPHSSLSAMCFVSCSGTIPNYSEESLYPLKTPTFVDKVPRKSTLLPGAI